jgi:O-antigen chain-terminating methyltransferase
MRSEDMVETNIPEITMDELMEKIRAEVRERQKMDRMRRPDIPNETRKHSYRPFDTADISRGVASEGPEPLEHKEQGYHINDFLKYHDQQFVVNAYQGILRRRPDSTALNYFLEGLRTGKMTKAEILGRLRYASEGRKKRVKIRGLFWNFVVQSSFRIPVLGYFTRLTAGIGNLPLILRNFQVLEEALFSQLENQRNDVEILKAKEREVTSAHKQLKAIVDHKANREELDAVLDRKADREEVEALDQKKVGVEELVHVSEVKADLKDVIAMTEVKVNREEFEGLKREARDLKLGVLDQQHRLRILLTEARKRLPEPISTHQLHQMLAEEDHLLDAMYVSFEDRERGTRQDMKHRLEVYIPYIRKADAGTADFTVVDVGCGRGEWLELLKENGFVARGVDTNRVMERECQELGLDVVMGDGVEFLKRLKPQSVGAVTGFHIVEHLPIRTMISLFGEAFRVLKPGGIVIFETPNPENIFVGSCTFYSDPTHRNPIPPNTLAFLIEYQGFVEPEIVRLHPLNYIEYNKEDALKDLVYRFNMGQDYAVIARKAS